MAITYWCSHIGGSDGFTRCTVLAATNSAGKVGVAIIQNTQSGVICTVPTGWTCLRSANSGGSRLYYNKSIPTGNNIFKWKCVGRHSGIIISFAGADATNPVCASNIYVCTSYNQKTKTGSITVSCALLVIGFTSYMYPSVSCWSNPSACFVTKVNNLYTGRVRQTVYATATMKSGAHNYCSQMPSGIAGNVGFIVGLKVGAAATACVLSTVGQATGCRLSATITVSPTVNATVGQASTDAIGHLGADIHATGCSVTNSPNGCSDWIVYSTPNTFSNSCQYLRIGKRSAGIPYYTGIILPVNVQRDAHIVCSWMRFRTSLNNAAICVRVDPKATDNETSYPTCYAQANCWFASEVECVTGVIPAASANNYVCMKCVGRALEQVLHRPGWANGNKMGIELHGFINNAASARVYSRNHACSCYWPKLTVKYCYTLYHGTASEVGEAHADGLTADVSPWSQCLLVCTGCAIACGLPAGIGVSADVDVGTGEASGGSNCVYVTAEAVWCSDAGCALADGCATDATGGNSACVDIGSATAEGADVHIDTVSAAYLAVGQATGGCSCTVIVIGLAAGEAYETVQRGNATACSRFASVISASAVGIATGLACADGTTVCITLTRNVHKLIRASRPARASGCRATIGRNAVWPGVGQATASGLAAKVKTINWHGDSTTTACWSRDCYAIAPWSRDCSAIGGWTREDFDIHKNE